MTLMHTYTLNATRRIISSRKTLDWKQHCSTLVLWFGSPQLFFLFLMKKSTTENSNWSKTFSPFANKNWLWQGSAHMILVLFIFCFLLVFKVVSRASREMKLTYPVLVLVVGVCLLRVSTPGTAKVMEFFFATFILLMRKLKRVVLQKLLKI